MLDWIFSSFFLYICLNLGVSVCVLDLAGRILISAAMMHGKLPMNSWPTSAIPFAACVSSNARQKLVLTCSESAVLMLIIGYSLPWLRNPLRQTPLRSLIAVSTKFFCLLQLPHCDPFYSLSMLALGHCQEWGPGKLGDCNINSAQWTFPNTMKHSFERSSTL